MLLKTQENQMKNTFYGLIAIGLIILLYRFMAGGSAPAQIEQRYRQPIMSALDKQLQTQSPLCTYQGPFPHPGNEICLFCKPLLEAGLIEERANDGVPDFVLTDAGIQAYREDPVPGSDNDTPRPRLCLGDASLGEVVDALPGMELNGVRYISFKYRIRVRNPHPWLKQNGAPTMKIPRLAANGDMLDKVYTTTATVLQGGKDIDFDSGFRYGKWVNEPTD